MAKRAQWCKMFPMASAAAMQSRSAPTRADHLHPARQNCPEIGAAADRQDRGGKARKGRYPGPDLAHCRPAHAPRLIVSLPFLNTEVS